MSLNHNSDIYSLRKPKSGYIKGQIIDKCHACGNDYVKRPNSRYCKECAITRIK